MVRRIVPAGRLPGDLEHSSVLRPQAAYSDGLRAWIYLALLAGGFTVAAVVVFKTNPHVIAERGKLHADTKFFDKITK